MTTSAITTITILSVLLIMAVVIICRMNGAIRLKAEENHALRSRSAIWKRRLESSNSTITALNDPQNNTLFGIRCVDGRCYDVYMVSYLRVQEQPAVPVYIFIRRFDSDDVEYNRMLAEELRDKHEESISR